MTIIVYAAIIALMAFLITDVIVYEPGEKRRLELERRTRVHTRSHHYKATRKRK